MDGPPAGGSRGVLPRGRPGLREAREAQGPKSEKGVKSALLRSQNSLFKFPSGFHTSPMDLGGPGGPGAPKVLKVHFGALWDLKTIDLTWENVDRIALGN